jgi:hypothetical protein
MSNALRYLSPAEKRRYEERTGELIDDDDDDLEDDTFTQEKARKHNRLTPDFLLLNNSMSDRGKALREKIEARKEFCREDRFLRFEMMMLLAEMARERDEEQKNSVCIQCMLYSFGVASRVSDTVKESCKKAAESVGGLFKTAAAPMLARIAPAKLSRLFNGTDAEESEDVLQLPAFTPVPA